MNPVFKRIPALLLALILPVLCCPATLAGGDDGWLEDDQSVMSHRPEKSADTASNPTPVGKSAAAGQVLLKGGVTFCVPKGTGIKMKLATVPSLGMKMLEHDLDGKLNPAQLNQVITAKTTEDIYVDDSKVIPQGTVFHGKVSKVLPPRRVGRPGSLVLTFDSFRTPDGTRSFAFEVQANNKKDSTTKTKAKGFGLIAAHAAGAAVIGALVAYEICGLRETIALHGYNIAAGAAAGALMGTAVAIMRHGPQAVLEPGDDLNMEIDTDLLMPAATAPTAKAPPLNLPGLDVHVFSTKVVKDGLDGYQLKVKAQVENNSRRRLQSIDLFIEDDNGNRFPMVPDAEEEHTDMLFTIDPCSSKLVYCDFQVEYPKLKRKLVWLDHNTRQVIYESRLP